jgi:hypothetical protein
MEKPTTKQSAQDRVILFCVATGINDGSVHITDQRCSPSGDSSRTIVRAVRIRSRTAAVPRSRRSLRVLRDAA